MISVWPLFICVSICLVIASACTIKKANERSRWEIKEIDYLAKHWGTSKETRK